MKWMRRLWILIPLGVLVLSVGSGSRADDSDSDSRPDRGQAGPLAVLLTNDDGFDSPGIRAMRGALLAAGHDVTIVAPLDQQSGKGGSLDTDVGGFVDVIEQEPKIWSVASTPSDSVRAALGAVLADSPPDLIVSGSNFGQNLGQTGTAASGTIGAALAGLFADIPAIAVSVGLDFAEAGETPIPFPSTLAAFGPTAEFTVRLIEQLQRTARDGELLPERTILNVNVPVPFDSVKGVEITRLARSADFDFVWRDVSGVIPTGGGPVLIDVEVAQGPDPAKDSDTNAYLQDFISISLLDGDMSAAKSESKRLGKRLRGLEARAADLRRRRVVGAAAP